MTYELIVGLASKIGIERFIASMINDGWKVRSSNGNMLLSDNKNRCMMLSLNVEIEDKNKLYQDSLKFIQYAKVKMQSCNMLYFCAFASGPTVAWGLGNITDDLFDK